MTDYREVIEEYKDGVNRIVLIRVESDVANTVYVSYEVLTSSFEEWSGEYSKLESEEYYTNVVEASAGYEQFVKELVGS